MTPSPSSHRASPCGPICASFSSRRGPYPQADRTAPCRSRRRLSGGFSRSCDQLRIGEATANRRAEQAGEPLHGVAAHVAVVEAEGELADVADKVLGADVVIGADQATLEDRKDALHAVRGYAVADVFAEAVIDAPLAVVEAVQRTIDRRFVGMQFRASIDRV